MILDLFSRSINAILISENVAVAIAGLAMITRSLASARSEMVDRKISRTTRLVRFRTTAFPTNRLTLIPTRERKLVELDLTNTTSGCAKDEPCFRTRLKSIDLERRNFLFKDILP